MLPFQGLLDTYNWKKTPGHTQNIVEGLYISHPTWECFRISKEDLEDVTVEKDVWGTLLCDLGGLMDILSLPKLN